MRVIKGKWPNGDPYHTTYPTSTKEVKILFLMNGIHAWPVKFGQRYSILYPNTRESGGPTFYEFDQPVVSIDALTLKTWLEVGRKNCPQANFQTPYEEKFCSFFKWPNMNKYIEKEKI